MDLSYYISFYRKSKHQKGPVLTIYLGANFFFVNDPGYLGKAL